MSKENLDSPNRKEQLQKDRPDFNRIKTSVETPAAGAANAVNNNEENYKPKSSVSTPDQDEVKKRVAESNKIIEENLDTMQPKIPEPEPAGKRVLTDDKKMFGLRAGTAAAGAALVADSVAAAAPHVVKAAGKAFSKDFGGAVNDLAAAAGELSGASKAATPADKLVNQQGKIKEEGEKSPGLFDKALDKIRTLPGGNTTANVLDKTVNTLTSKPVLRAAKAGGAIVSMAVLSTTPIGIAAGALSLGAIGLNAVKETLDVKKDHELDVEKQNLQNIKENKQKQAKHIVNFLAAKKSVSQENPESQKKSNLDEFLNDKLSNTYPTQTSTDKPFEGSKWKELARAVRDSMLENASVVLEGIGSGSIVGMAAAAATGLINTGNEADSNLVRRERRNDKINQINNLKLNTGEYKDKKELKELERQERINTTTLEEFLSNTPNLDKLSKVQLEAAFATKQKEVGERPEFAPPPEKTGFQKVKSAVKAGAGYFAESQFGDLKEIYGKKEEQKQSPMTPKLIKLPKLEEEKKHEVAQGKAQQLKKKLEKTISFAKGSSNPAPDATPSTHNHNRNESITH